MCNVYGVQKAVEIGLTTYYGLRTTGYEQRTTDYGLRTTDYGLRTTPQDYTDIFNLLGPVLEFRAG